MQARIELAPATKNSASLEPSVVPTNNQAGKHIDKVTSEIWMCHMFIMLLPTAYKLVNDSLKIL